MATNYSPRTITDGLVFYYDMNNTQKSWKGAPAFNASLQNGQNDISPWSGDGSPTSLGIDPVVRFRGRKVAKFQTGTSGNCYINGSADLSTSTTSTVWTFTIYLKRVDGTPLSTIGMYLYISNNTNINTTATLTPVEDGWYRAVYTRNGLAGVPTLAGMFGLGVATQYYFADWQCENNSFSSPWVTGTRSNTEAILDLTNNNTVTANSLTYNNDGSFSFNGSSNFLTNSQNIIKTSGGWTVENWFKLDVVNSGSLYNFIGDSVITYNSWYWTVFQSRLALWNRSPGQWLFGSTTIQPNVWYHASIVCSDSGTQYQFYLNGVAEGGTHATYSWNASFAGLQMGFIGRGDASNGRYFDGQLPAIKVYNRALTANEVAQNFAASRGRYGV